MWPCFYQFPKPLQVFSLPLASSSSESPRWKVHDIFISPGCLNVDPWTLGNLFVSKAWISKMLVLRNDMNAHDFVCFVLSNCLANLGMHSQKACLCKTGCCRTLTQRGTLLCWLHKALCRVLQCIWHAVDGCGQFCKEEAEKDGPTKGSTRFYLAYHFTENQRILELCAGGDDWEEHRRARNESGWECNQQTFRQKN